MYKQEKKDSSDRLTAKQLKKKVQHLKGERGTWENHWQEVADLILPRKATITTKRPDGAKRTAQVLDNTGILSNELLAGALHGLLTNPYGDWFELTTGNSAIDQTDEARTWLQKTTRQIHNVLNNSNFQTEIHEVYTDLPAIGTACMFIEDHPTDIVKFSAKFISEYYIDENAEGFVDQIYRIWEWNAFQIVDEFGYDKVPECVQKSYSKGDETKYEIIHAVYPKKMVDPSASDSSYVSQYVLTKEDFELRVGKFNEAPYVTPRWTKAAGEKYGRGPGMTALPEMKVLNKMTETTLIGAQKVVDPPLMVPDDGFILPIITTPGGLNYYRSGTNDYIKPVFNDTRMDFGYQAIEDRRKRIRAAYYVDQLQLQQGGPMMTATEVMQRTEEQMRLLGPMLGRQHNELLRPLIRRVYSIMARRKLIDKAPDSIRGLDVRYSSSIAKAQRMNDAQNVTRAMQAATPFIQLNPQVADNYDGDSISRLLVQVFGAPQEMLRSTQDRDALRQQRQQQQQQQAQMMQEQQNMQQNDQLLAANRAINKGTGS